jgi:Uma2 family endonuclease
MTQSKLKFACFEDYLTWSNDPSNLLDGQFELINGGLIELPPESGVNDAIANRLFFRLVASGTLPLNLVRPGKCEIQVPVLRSGDAANRYPDLVVLQPEHLMLIQTRLTITQTMTPPQLVAEILSPGRQNRDRDVIYKRDQYAARGIPEYWLIDPQQGTIQILQLQDGAYREFGIFQGSQAMSSPTLPNLSLMPADIFAET